MKFTLSWLREFLDTNASLDEIDEKLTSIGIEVEEIIDNSKALEPFIIAQVSEVSKHPDADKLNVCTVEYGADKPVQVVCGAPNVYKGMKAVLGLPGTYVPGLDVTLKKASIRGVESHGMLCSAEELQQADASDGILDLPQDAPVGAKYALHYNLVDPVFDVSLTPNRADCFGIEGIARDLAAAGLGTFKPAQSTPIKGSFASPINITIDDTKGCPAYYGVYLKGVKNGESPDWLKARMRMVGLKSISAAVDVTNYINFHLCRPLHVFDAHKLDGDINIRRANSDEKIVALDEDTYTLSAEHLVVADNKGPVAIAGVMGGLNSGVSFETTDIFLECAYFDPIDVAIAGRNLNIISDARTRFERGVDPQGTLRGLEIAAEMIVELCGGQASHVVKAGDAPHNKNIVTLPYTEVKNMLGVERSANDIKTYLEKIGCITLEETNGFIKVETPSWRYDLAITEDLVEEVARLSGYDNIPNDVPLAKVSDVIKNDKLDRLNSLRRMLAGVGLDECLTYSFLPQEQAEIFGGGADELQLLNPISNDLKTMRPSLLANMLTYSQKNMDKGHKTTSLFEIGAVYENNRDEGQKTMASSLLRGPKTPPHWSTPQKEYSAFDAKALLMAALSHLGIDLNKITIERGAPSYYHPMQSGVVKLGPKNVLGYFGTVSPAVMKKMDIEGEAAAFEVYIDNVPFSKKKKITSHKSELTPIERDFAFVMNKDTPVGDILKSIMGAEKSLIKDIHVFDIYEGKGIEPNQKSVAFKVIIEPQEKTLTDSDIQNICDSIVKNVNTRTGSTLRA